MNVKTAKVGILMGSESDLPVMKGASEILKEFNVSYYLTILSAHRTPDLLKDFIAEAISGDMRVIIAGAGGAAHLAGVIAAHFPFPVIGVPINSSTLGGMDSLLSTVQMPPGVPVATVAINGSKNAGLLAIEILSVSDGMLSKRLLSYRTQLSRSVISSANSVAEEEATGLSG